MNMKKYSILIVAFFMLTLSNIFAQSQFRYDYITPSAPFPQLGPWTAQNVYYGTYVIEQCTIKVVAEWSCRIITINGVINMEIYLNRFSIIASSQECLDKAKNYYFAQIFDMSLFDMFSNANCFTQMGLNDISLCKNGMKSVFRVYINFCGHETKTIEGDFLHYVFEPCDLTSFCRIKYSYCYQLINGKMQLVEFVEKENDPAYNCPPKMFIGYDLNGMPIYADCGDENCGLRKTGFYELSEGITKPDHGGNPPEEVDPSLFIK